MVSDEQVLGAAWLAGISDGDLMLQYDPDMLLDRKALIKWDVDTLKLLYSLPQSTAITIRYQQARSLSSSRTSMFKKHYKRHMSYRDKERRRIRGDLRLSNSRTIDNDMIVWDRVNWRLFEDIAFETFATGAHTRREEPTMPVAPALPAPPVTIEKRASREAPSLPASPPVAIDVSVTTEGPDAPAMIEQPTLANALVTTEEPAQEDHDDAMSDATDPLPEVNKADMSDATDAFLDAHEDPEFGVNASDQDEDMESAQNSPVYARAVCISNHSNGVEK